MRSRRSVWKQCGRRSGFEKRVEENLKMASGIRVEYEDRKYKYVKLICPCCGGVVKSGTYTPDFSIYSRDTGELLFTVEAKGRFTGEDRNKLLAVRTANPEFDLRLLFQRDDAIRKGSKTRNSTWAEKHGFDFHVGEQIPERWVK